MKLFLLAQGAGDEINTDDDKMFWLNDIFLASIDECLQENG